MSQYVRVQVSCQDCDLDLTVEFPQRVAGLEESLLRVGLRKAKQQLAARHLWLGHGDTVEAHVAGVHTLIGTVLRARTTR